MQPPPNTNSNAERLRKYYRFQSKIYDLTRWSFLFGRQRVLTQLPLPEDEPFHLLEVGCGTGHNLKQAARRYQEAQFTGVDISEDMLDIAGDKLAGYGEQVTLLRGYYGEVDLPVRPNVILFSYCLTMVNPGFEALLDQAHADLLPGGIIAVADFHDTSVAAFRRHMAGHHVRMEGQVLTALEERFTPLRSEVSRAYGGVWRYLVFTGRR